MYFFGLVPIMDIHLENTVLLTQWTPEENERTPDTCKHGMFGKYLEVWLKNGWIKITCSKERGREMCQIKTSKNNYCICFFSILYKILKIVQ